MTGVTGAAFFDATQPITVYVSDGIGSAGGPRPGNRGNDERERGSKRDPVDIMDGDGGKTARGTERNRADRGWGRVTGWLNIGKAGFLLPGFFHLVMMGCVALHRISTSRARLLGNERKGKGAMGGIFQRNCPDINAGKER